MNADTRKLVLGGLFKTHKADSAVSQLDMMVGIARHRNGDWGDVSTEQVRSNERALQNRSKVRSSYLSTEGRRFWVVTDFGEAATTVYLSEEL